MTLNSDLDALAWKLNGLEGKHGVDRDDRPALYTLAKEHGFGVMWMAYADCQERVHRSWHSGAERVRNVGAYFQKCVEKRAKEMEARKDAES